MEIHEQKKKLFEPFTAHQYSDTRRDRPIVRPEIYSLYTAAPLPPYFLRRNVFLIRKTALVDPATSTHCLLGFRVPSIVTSQSLLSSTAVRQTIVCLLLCDAIEYSNWLVA